MTESPDLPAEYFDWLAELPKQCYVTFQRREYEIAPRAQLTQPMRFTQDEVPYYAQLAAYVKLQHGLGYDAAHGPKGSRFPYTRLAHCVTIGTDNGDPLFVDPTDHYSVWMLHHDSECGEVERIAPTIQEWIQKARPVD